MGSRLKCVFVCVVLAAVSLGSSAQTIDMQADWIPTDLNYAMISRLAKDPLANLTSQIKGYSILGVISNQDVADWLSVLTQNRNVRDGTVRWQPAVAAKCGSGQKGCTKSIKVTVLEFTYGNANGSDCKANALIAADSILPPYATLKDSVPGQSQSFMATGYPITYQITAAPNATAANCTYIVTYPQATQNLANTLCFQGGNNCANSSCVPCNANTTISVGPDPENNCTPQNGVAHSLVAAVEGAAQCLSMGGMGRFQCSVGYPENSPCQAMHCFPGDASIMTESGREKMMQDLQIGERVQVVKKDGSLGYEDVYFFGHRDADSIGQFIKLTIETREGKLQHLELSSHHFMYARAKTSEDPKFKAMRAKDVEKGLQVQVSSDRGLQIAEIVAIEIVMKQGLWNPYTLGGSIIVNRVAVSSHSEWLLDPLLDRVSMTQYLPAVYQALLFPMRLMYYLLGQQAISKIDSYLEIGRVLSSISL